MIFRLKAEATGSCAPEGGSHGFVRERSYGSSAGRWELGVLPVRCSDTAGIAHNGHSASTERSFNMPKSILIITGDAGESYEVLYSLHRFQEAGYTAHIAAPSRRRLRLVMHDFEPGWDT